MVLEWYSYHRSLAEDSLEALTFRSPWLRGGIIVSDEGFQVKRVSFYEMRYDEPGLSLTVECKGISEIGIFPTPSRSATEGTELELDSSDQERILQNIVRAFAWKGYAVCIFGPAESARRRSATQER
jgi:hypothetical protein